MKVYKFTQREYCGGNKTTYNNQNFDKKSIGKITKLINKTDKNIQYYFILGYIDYINKDYKSSSKNFEQAKNKILETNSSFIKRYIYFIE